MSGSAVAVLSLVDGDYHLLLYHTWLGQVIFEEKKTIKKGSYFYQTVLKIKDSHAHYIGQDMAFVLMPVE